MSPITVESYARHLNNVSGSKYYTRRPRIMCCCGKSVYEGQLERHQTTKIHSELMRRKEIYEKSSKVL